MRVLAPSLLCFAVLGLPAQDVSRLPEWAREAAASAQKETAPKDADAWVLLQRQDYIYEGKGLVRTRRYRLVRIMGQRGLVEGGFAIYNYGGRVHKVKTLKGWNLRPDGEMVKLSKDDMAVLDPDDYGEVSKSTLKAAELPQVVVGSLVAFETEETARMPLGPWGGDAAVEYIPVRRWEFHVGTDGGPASVVTKVDLRHWEDWGIKTVPLAGGGFAADNLPSRPWYEDYHPPLASFLPHAQVRFIDPTLTETPSLADWNSIASWCANTYKPAVVPSGQLPVAGLGPREALTRIEGWMNRELIYHATYLSPDRGWVPATCPDVVRRRNGDCKDHTACLLGEASGAGLEGYPALCNIYGKETEPDGPVEPNAFNHVIAAIKLKESLGLPAEVTTPGGRFLLVDTTDRYCPFGRLPDAHRRRKVLICTPGAGYWVTVPPAATVVPELRLDLTGELDPNNVTRAQIRIQETADAWALRATALEGGEAELKAHTLRSLLDLPPTATLSDLKIGDPLDLEHPFEVTFTVARAAGFTLASGRYHLESWGMPGALPSIQKPATPRRLPLEIRRDTILDYHAAWTFPAPVTQVLPALDVENPFADVAWRARAEARKASFDLRVRYKDAKFEGDQREAGVAAWKKLRFAMSQVKEDGLSFRTVTPP